MLKNIVFFLLVTCTASELSCQECVSEDPDSDCRDGIIKEKFSCQPDKQACYTEYIKGNGGSSSYRRGCSPRDWCKTRKENLGIALKYCSVCKGCDMCNSERIGPENPSRIQCYKCETKDPDDDCTKASIDIKSATCLSREYYCSQSILNNTNGFIWERDCAKYDYCDKRKKKYGQSLAECTTCANDYCNNIPLYTPSP